MPVVRTGFAFVSFNLVPFCFFFLLVWFFISIGYFYWYWFAIQAWFTDERGFTVYYCFCKLWRYIEGCIYLPRMVLA